MKKMKELLYNFLLYFLGTYGGKKLEENDLTKCIDDYYEILKDKKKAAVLVYIWWIWLVVITVVQIYILFQI